MRTCTKCQTPKEATDFYFQCGKPKNWCKSCDKASSSAYLKSQAGKESRKKCDLKHKQLRLDGRRRYYSSEVGKKIRNLEITRGLSAAGLAVTRAIKDGIIFRKNICAGCFFESVATHFHHLKGYEKEILLDVVELCVTCHREAHAEPDHQFHPRTDKWQTTAEPVY